MKLRPAPDIPPLRWTPSLQKLRVLTVRQPYAWLIVHGIKDIENRSRRTHIRGPILIQAGASRAEVTPENLAKYQAIGRVRLPEDFEVGGVIGYAEIVDCVRDHGSPWKDPDSWGWVLAKARPLKFRPCRGALGFFRPTWG